MTMGETIVRGADQAKSEGKPRGCVISFNSPQIRRRIRDGRNDHVESIGRLRAARL